MPQTPTFGFEYETPQTKPGITLTGDQDGSSPILAEQVDIALAGVDARLSGVEGDVAILQTQTPTDTGWVALPTTPAAGWTLTSAVYRRWGPVTSIRVEYERSGAAIVAGATGNVVGDPTIATINDIDLRPNQQQLVLVQASVTSGGGTLDTNGVLNVTDLNSGSSIATNDRARVSWTYFTSTFS